MTSGRAEDDVAAAQSRSMDLQASLPQCDLKILLLSNAECATLVMAIVQITVPREALILTAVAVFRPSISRVRLSQV
jgi:hypothetical protein